MALAPSLLLILGSPVQWLLDRLGFRASRFVPISVALLATLAVILLVPAATPAALWQPEELFGPGFEFRLDDTSWPFAFLATSMLVAALLRQESRFAPLHLLTWGLGIAAILASNVLTSAVLWTTLTGAEATICLKGNAKLEHLFLRIWSHAAAVVLILGFALSRAGAQLALGGTLLAAAVVLRTPTITPGDLESRASPDARLAWLSALVALSTASRQVTTVEGFPGLIAIGGLGLLLSIAIWVARPSILWPLPLGLVCVCLLMAGLSAGEAWRGLATAAAIGAVGAGLLLYGSRWWGARKWAAALAIGLLPLAFSSLSPWSLDRIVATLAVAALVTGILGLPDQDTGLRRQESAFLGLIVVVATAVYVVVRTGIAPDGVLAGAVGVGLGVLGAIGIERLRERSDITRLFGEELVGLRKSLRSLWAAVALAIRSVTGLLEGQSAVLWMFLALLTAAIVIRSGSG